MYSFKKLNISVAGKIWSAILCMQKAARSYCRSGRVFIAVVGRGAAAREEEKEERDREREIFERKAVPSSAIDFHSSELANSSQQHTRVYHNQSMLLNSMLTARKACPNKAPRSHGFYGNFYCVRISLSLCPCSPSFDDMTFRETHWFIEISKLWNFVV